MASEGKRGLRKLLGRKEKPDASSSAPTSSQNDARPVVTPAAAPAKAAPAKAAPAKAPVKKAAPAKAVPAAAPTPRKVATPATKVVARPSRPPATPTVKAAAPVKAPAKAAAPAKAPAKALAKAAAPVKASAKAAAPVRAPAKAAAPVKAPAKAAPAKKATPAQAPTKVAAPAVPEEVPTDAAASAGAPVTAPAKAPAKAPVKAAAKAPAKAPAKPEIPSGPLTGDDAWTKKELGDLRKELLVEAKDLRGEIDVAEEVNAALKRDAGSEGTGDEADAGSKTFEREHEMSIANNSRDLLQQVERALARLDAGTYGRCENCGNPIPKPRLQAFPRATLCVSCKTREERR